jgi:hypothetical protein
MMAEGNTTTLVESIAAIRRVNSLLSLENSLLPKMFSLMV